MGIGDWGLGIGDLGFGFGGLGGWGGDRTHKKKNPNPKHQKKKIKKGFFFF